MTIIVTIVTIVFILLVILLVVIWMCCQRYTLINCVFFISASQGDAKNKPGCGSERCQIFHKLLYGPESARILLVVVNATIVVTVLMVVLIDVKIRYKLINCLYLLLLVHLQGDTRNKPGYWLERCQIFHKVV